MATGAGVEGVAVSNRVSKKSEQSKSLPTNVAPIEADSVERDGDAWVVRFKLVAGEMRSVRLTPSAMEGVIAAALADLAARERAIEEWIGEDVHYLRPLNKDEIGAARSKAARLAEILNRITGKDWQVSPIAAYAPNTDEHKALLKVEIVTTKGLVQAYVLELELSSIMVIIEEYAKAVCE